MRCTAPALALIALASILAVSTPSLAAPSKVTIAQTPSGGYQLRVDGKPFFIQGAGGDASKQVLVNVGGNSFRTWGADDIDAKLDEAQKLGLKVCVGIWLGHERHGFNYNNADQVAAQYEKAKAAILKYKDHPAVLMWAIGNEMDGYKEGDNAAIWSAVNNIAALAKKLDPNHPTMTVVAEVGGKRIRCIHQLCPDIDIVGINSYAGVASIPQRYREAGGTKPYVITEFGPPGTWEVEKNGWGAAPEPTSTQKAQVYRDGYARGIAAERDKLCLGSYVFAWGNKQEATATWFGMFLPDGTRTAAVDAMQEAWTGKQPANRVPTVEPIQVEGGPRFAAGATFTARVAAADPENDKLQYQWLLAKETEEYGVGGDHEAAPQSFPDAVTGGTEATARVKLPAHGGGYRLFVFVRDGKGGGAVANIPLFVEGGTAAPAAPTAAGAGVKLPFVLYADDAPKTPYVWSGWMGNIDGLGVDEKCTINPHAGRFCMKLEYRAPTNFGGVVWVDPPNDWGDAVGGYNLTGAKKLTFWARGEAGGERVEFKFGVIGKDKKSHDSDTGATTVTLTNQWQQYSIDLAGKDLGNVKTGFVWVVGGQGKPVTFYLDDVRYE